MNLLKGIVPLAMQHYTHQRYYNEEFFSMDFNNPTYLKYVVGGVGYTSKYTKDLITMYTSKNEDFKVLQLSDLHLTSNLDGGYANGKPEETYANITQIISQTKPNLIVFTGDIFYHNLARVQEFRSFMDSFKIN